MRGDPRGVPQPGPVCGAGTTEVISSPGSAQRLVTGFGVRGTGKLQPSLTRGAALERGGRLFPALLFA